MTHELAALYAQRKAEWCCLTVEQRERVYRRYQQLLSTRPAIPAFCVAVAEIVHVLQVAAEARAEAGRAYH